MIKPIFGFDVTDDKNSDKIYADQFIYKKLDGEALRQLNEAKEALDATANKAKLPIYVRTLRYVALLFGLLIVGSMFRADISLLETIRRASVLSISGILALILGGALWVFEKIREKRIFELENIQEKMDNLESAAQKASYELGIPENAYVIDVLVCNYTVKNGKVKLYTPPLASTPFINVAMRAYFTDNKLCIADAETVFSFPLGILRVGRRINKNAILPQWNKDEAYNKGEYKQYNLRSSNMGIHAKPYYVLEVERCGETLGIYFPCYERYVFENLIGISVVEYKDTDNEQ